MFNMKSVQVQYEGDDGRSESVVYATQDPFAAMETAQGHGEITSFEIEGDA